MWNRNLANTKKKPKGSKPKHANPKKNPNMQPKKVPKVPIIQSHQIHKPIIKLGN